MKKVVFVGVGVAILISLVVVAVVTAAPGADGTLRAYFEPSTYQATLGEEFSMDLWAEATTELTVQGMSANITFDPSFLEVTAFTDGCLGTHFDSFDNGAGTIAINASILGPSRQTEPCAVKNITFKVKDDAPGGATAVHFDAACIAAGPGPDCYTTLLEDGEVIVPVEVNLVVNVAPQGAVDAGCNVDQNPMPPPPYMTNDVVELTANAPDPCWTFVDWTGDLVTDTNPASITMDVDKEVTATFEAPLFMLTVTPVGNGTVVANPDKPGGYDCGEDVELTATPTGNARFKEWSGDLTGSDNPDTISMVGSDKVVTATFVDTYTVTFTDPDPADGTITVVQGNPDDYFDDGETITVTVNPAACREFAGWTGDLAAYGTQMEVAIVLDGDLDFGADFSTPDYDLVVLIDNAPGVTGTVTLSPTGGTYPCGTDVTLTPAIVGGVGIFDEWSGDLTGSDNPAVITMNDNYTVTAHFLSTIRWDFPPTVPGGTISTDPTQPPDGFIPGTLVTLTAAADYCYQFDGWTGALESYGTQTPIAIPADAPMTFSATFSLITYDSLTANIDPVGAGTVALDPASGPYDCGTTITATATPMSGTLWVFENWSGAATGESNPVSFVLDETSGTTLTAHFMMYKLYLPLVVRNA
jgi:hypothetical protein